MSEIQLYNAIDQAIEDWLAARTANSQRTAKAYRDMMADFRAALRKRNADLLSDPALVSLTAEQWAASSRTGKKVSASTFNLRLTCISSFFIYLGKKSVLSGHTVVNPIAAIDRRKRQPYARAMPLDAKDVRHSLKAIDRTTTQGKRDFALLTVLTVTGRRLSEVANMVHGDLTISEKTITINFPRCKGGKSMSDRLTSKQAAAVLDYLHALHGEDLASLPADAPVWVSLSRRNPGQKLGIQSIADVCQKHLGVSKVHALRHTFAVLMEEVGAPITEIQKRLGHSSLNETSIYLERLHAAENPYAGKLDDLLDTGD